MSIPSSSPTGQQSKPNTAGACTDLEHISTILPRVFGLPCEVADEELTDRLTSVLIAAGLDGRMSWEDVADLLDSREREAWVRSRRRWLIYVRLGGHLTREESEVLTA